jgi:hypothetical protein
MCLIGVLCVAWIRVDFTHAPDNPTDSLAMVRA